MAWSNGSSSNPHIFAAWYSPFMWKYGGNSLHLKFSHKSMQTKRKLQDYIKENSLENPQLDSLWWNVPKEIHGHKMKINNNGGQNWKLVFRPTRIPLPKKQRNGSLATQQGLYHQIPLRLLENLQIEMRTWANNSPHVDPPSPQTYSLSYTLTHIETTSKSKAQ